MFRLGFLESGWTAVWTASCVLEGLGALLDALSGRSWDCLGGLWAVLEALGDSLGALGGLLGALGQRTRGDVVAQAAV